MSAGFTPGPWIAKDAYRGQGFWIMREERGQGWVRDKRLDSPAGEFDETDARLIAAAPDLYEQLLEAERLLGNHSVHEDDLPPISAALAKARGETL